MNIHKFLGFTLDTDCSYYYFVDVGSAYLGTFAFGESQTVQSSDFSLEQVEIGVVISVIQGLLLVKVPRPFITKALPCCGNPLKVKHD